MTHISPQTHPVGSTAAKTIDPKTNNGQTAEEKMAADFEAIFARQMLAAMRTSSLGEGLFEGQGMEQFRDMQDSMLAEHMANKGIFGIANLLTSHVTSNVEKTNV